MALTRTQQEFYAYCEGHDFVSAAVLAEFERRLHEEGNVQTFSFALERFLPADCPHCHASGMYKFHFLGRLKHADCGKEWYLAPRAYAVAQLQSALRAGASAGGGIMSEAERKGEKGGTLGGIAGFLVVGALRLVLAVALIPIQALVFRSQARQSAAETSART